VNDNHDNDYQTSKTAEVLKIIIKEHIVTTLTVSKNDRLHKVSIKLKIKTALCKKVLLASDVPSGIDLIVCAHSFCFITKQARDKTKYGAIGYHPSLLPNHKGKDSVEKTIFSGDRIAGGSIYWLNDKMDGGDIMLQSMCSVEKINDARSLWLEKLAPLGVELLTLAIDLINRGYFLKSPQK
jgi:methionyl-tRNA formyltransferase